MPGTWDTRTAMPGTVIDGCCEGVGTKVYCIGGEIPFSGSNASTAVHIYDTVANTWTQKTSCTNQPAPSKMLFVNGLMYAHTPAQSGSTAMQIYDPVADTWSTGASAPGLDVPQIGYYSTGGRIHYPGGINLSSAPSTDHWIYNISANTYQNNISTCPVLPTARGGGASIVDSGRLFLAGGKSTSQARVSVVHVFDFAAASYTTDTAMPTPRDRMFWCSLGGQLYCIAGHIDGNTAVRTHERYTPAPRTGGWSVGSVAIA